MATSDPDPPPPGPSPPEPDPAADARANLPVPSPPAEPPVTPRRLHPASPVLAVSNVGRALLAPGAVALGTGGLRLLAVGVVVVLAVRVLAWWRRTYVLDAGVLRVESGLVVRSQQLVPCERIQQVDLVQRLRHRLLGVAVLEVRTAVGGLGSGVSLDVLAIDEAERLRAALLQARARAAGGAEADHQAPWVPSAWPVVELSHVQLAIAGVTGVQLLVVLAFAATAVQFVGELPWNPLEAIEIGALGLMGGVGVVVLVAGFAAVWLGGAAAVSIFANSGYRLSLVGDELALSRGLLDRREATLPLSRVQAVRISASAPRRLLGLVSMRIQSAGSGSGSGAAGDDSRVSVPILPAADLGRVLSLVLPGAGAVPPLHRPPRAALRRALVRRVVPATAAALVPAVVLWPGGVLALLAVPVSAGLGVAAYRGLGHAVAGRFLITRLGSLNRQTMVVPVERAQSATVRATFWQRRLGLATMAVDLAGPGPRARVVDESHATAERLLSRVGGGDDR